MTRFPPIVALAVTVTAKQSTAFAPSPVRPVVKPSISSAATSSHTIAPTQTQPPTSSRRHHIISSLRATSAALHDTTLAQGIEAIDAALPTLAPLFSELRDLPYFSLYSCDMLASCEYLPQELFECYTESCEIYPVDDEEVPESIKSSDFTEHEFELDGWARWDMPSDDYYDTKQFPEDYTGYDGSEIWSFIHNRIGFHDGAMGMDEYDADDWKADFNKAVSGLHAMVSAQVVRGMREKIESGEGIDPDSYTWTNPVVEFERRLGPNGETPEAVENLYFTMMLLLSGVRAARDRLLTDCDSGTVCQDAQSVQALRSILTHPLLDDPSIDAAVRRLKEHAMKDTNSLWEARMRTRDLMRIMNCVQCNKCRFHGKISTLGLSTALQLAVGHGGTGGDPKKIHRVELAALVTALGKFSSGIDLCLEMQ
ncbi:predicted protein [Thalassiosira pseudonana CCMP1335]|uniref:Endoplasmic reticulum oxidoreductin 1 n=1 Tax=Thalassiosira pseudonana TaxID=35128 RepID=B8C3R5_THAPS|nr:predicted protein [Thalassiosira pseudonana CCMP1335]EED92607.1 predicted protein [Thalassiosira pseudonana CCMP1335]